MKKPCQHIQLAIDIALLNGNEIYSQFSASFDENRLVVFLSVPLTAEVKVKIEQQCGNLED
jgi:hypothetical protein